MKVVILAGGLGTRISEESDLKPKPMINIGEMPIIWHIMKIYSTYGLKDFIICCGYKGEMIIDYFNRNNKSLSHTESSLSKIPNDWKITLVDTGLETMTGGRLKRVKNLFTKDEDFHFTYGDGLADVNINDLTGFHRKNDSLCTVTAVFPPSRFGALQINSETMKVTSFKEKPTNETQLINGGFFVLNSKVFEYIDGDHTVWEKEPMEKLSRENNLSAYRHKGFFGPMDTLRDKRNYEEMWNLKKAKWKIWKD